MRPFSMFLLIVVRVALQALFLSVSLICLLRLGSLFLQTWHRCGNRPREGYVDIVRALSVQRKPTHCILSIKGMVQRIPDLVIWQHCTHYVLGIYLRTVSAFWAQRIIIIVIITPPVPTCHTSLHTGPRRQIFAASWLGFAYLSSHLWWSHQPLWACTSPV